MVKGISGRVVRRAGEQYTDKKFLILVHNLTSIETTKYFSYKHWSNGTFSRDNLHRIKDEPYAINLDDKQSKEIHWVSLFIEGNIAACFDSFKTELLNKIKDTSTHNIFRMQDDYIVCGFHFIIFTEYVLAGRTLLDLIFSE